jgi:radical SAM protein with 4Fe4S-binding SPASM domain
MSHSNGSPYSVTVKTAEHRLWKDRAPLLERLEVEFTERCNNNCVHCWINLPEDCESARRRELSIAELKAILTDAAGLGCLSVLFTGGEPLLREDFAEIYVFARRLGLKVSLYTNARQVTPELADLLAGIPPLEPVEVTVYGMSEGSYEAVSRVSGSFAEFQRGVRLLLDRDVALKVRSVLLPQNRKDRRAFEDWSAAIPAMDSPAREILSLNLRVRRDDAYRNRQIAGLRIGPEESVEVLNQIGDEYRREAYRICYRFMGPCDDRLFDCGAGRCVCLDAYGVLQPCMDLRHPETVYDLKKGSLEHALREFFPRIVSTRATNPDYLSRCATCFLHGFCDQCPGKSWTEHGTLDTPVEYLCDMAHAQARDLGLLEEDERGWEVDDWKQRLELCKQWHREIKQPARS